MGKTIVMGMAALLLAGTSRLAHGQVADVIPAKLEQWKVEAAADVDRMKDLSQQMVDTVFSFAELGFQELETSRYLTGILRDNGFAVKEGIAGIPTAWIATWGSGHPVISLGSDVDCIPQASQKPGVAYREPIVAGAPGHGEGHNSGVPLNITAAIAVKRIMERETLPGTIQLWPGIAEELLGAKAQYVRAGVFKGVDAALFTHVSNNLSVSWGYAGATGVISIEYLFAGEAAHAGNAPWRGHSALDAVELMDIGWNFRREHLRTQQRSHYVITNGGDQPNVVPSTASVWYYLRETEYPRIRDLLDKANAMAKAASMMTDTTFTTRIIGSAWPQHMNKVLAETAFANIKVIGLPTWSADDQRLAKAVQKEVKAVEKGLDTELEKLGEPIKEEDNKLGGSDDIGDVSWNVPTITLKYPANIPGLPGHHWSNAIAMATPIAHQGVIAGAKVQALTMLDLLIRHALVKNAWDYFKTVQTKGQKYVPFIGKDDKPALWLNTATMQKFRPELQRFYYDAKRFKTYLEQLGVKYPTVR